MNLKLFPKVYYYLIFLLLFFIPINNLINAYLIGGLIVLWLLEGKFQSKFNNIIKKPYTFLFIGYYLIYFIGLLYSKNIKFGLFDLQIKLSILFFPLFFASLDKSFFDNIKLFQLLKTYIAGCLTGSIICLANAAYNFFKDNKYADNFYYMNLSLLFHPSYYSLYLNFAIVIILYFLIENPKPKIQISNFKFQISFISYSLIIFFTIMIILLSSKAGLISLILIYILSISYLFIHKRKYSDGIILFLITFFTIIFSLHFFPYVKERISLSKHTISSKLYTTNNNINEGTYNRILVWKTSLELMKEHPLFGVGTGDVKDVLVNRYKKNKITYAYEYKLNAHCQYLQTFIATGTVGFLILILSLLLPAIKILISSFRFQGSGKLIYLLFLIIFSFNMVVESMLEVQAGVVFYAFFNSLLFYKKD